MIQIDSNEKEVHVTIPRTDLTPEQLEKALRPFRFSRLTSHSQMSQSEAMIMAEESKSTWWQQNEHLFISSNQ